jgi:molybdopterin/thiamine biosynthesis adenylyltransferase
MSKIISKEDALKKFSYNEFTTRNLGFVDEREQTILKKSKVFIPGVGGMGGTVLEALARIGIENFIIADLDTFEISNLNRQIFSNLNTIDHDKAEVAKDAILNINPNITVEVYGADWVTKLDKILPEVDLVINGCDDVKSTIALMRNAKKYNKTVIDAFASVLPSVYVVTPADPRPEVNFNFPTINLEIDEIDLTIEKACAALEIEYVLVHSSSANHVHMKFAAEMISGKRKRISFAPMVWTTSTLMCYEAVKLLLGKKNSVSYRGIFLNPWTLKYERPLPEIIAFFKRILVKLFLKKLGGNV